MKNLTIYILQFECDYYGTMFEAFTNKDDKYYIKYTEKGDKEYITKHGTLEELVGEYDYIDGKLKVSLIERSITI